MRADTDPAHRQYAWTKDAPPGAESCEIASSAAGMKAIGVAIGSAPVPYRVDYALETDPDWTTLRLEIVTRGDGWSCSLALGRDPGGAWTASRTSEGRLPRGEVGVVVPELDPSVLDVDIQYSPVTNLMPIRRIGLDRIGHTETFTMAWIALPSLGVVLDRQIYTILPPMGEGHSRVRYQSADGTFEAIIECDDDGVVLDYPGIARRLC